MSGSYSSRKLMTKKKVVLGNISGTELQAMGKKRIMLNSPKRKDEMLCTRGGGTRNCGDRV